MRGEIAYVRHREYCTYLVFRNITALKKGQKDNGDLPGHLSPWSKVLAEWLEPTVIDTSGEYTLKAAEISDECYRITLADYGIVAEYLHIENRQPLEFPLAQ